MESKYYIPTINEFVKGFKFEYLTINDYAFVALDFTGSGSIDCRTEYHNEKWVSKECDWKYSNSDTFTETTENISLTYFGGTRNFFSEFNDDRIKQLIEDGRIRAIKH